METWTLISLYIVQTLIGAVLWRRFLNNNEDNNNSNNNNNDGFTCLLISAFVLPNIIFLLVFISHLISKLIDFLAGKGTKNKNKTALEEVHLLKLGFQKTDDCLSFSIKDNYGEEYLVNHEGYAWVLYKIHQDKKVPIQDFRNKTEFIKFFKILYRNSVMDI